MISISGEQIANFTIPLPKGRGKNKNKIASLNELPKWHWKVISDVQKQYKQIIKDWYISSYESDPLPSMTILFKLHRHNDRVLDSDNLGFIIKWTIDAIKESGWLIDDDQITYIVEPSRVNRDLIETSIEVLCYK